MNEPVEQKESMLNRVRELKDHPALLGWVLGNEIPESVLIEKGNEVFESALNDLFNSIKKIDSAHPLTHSNWPPAELLDLHFTLSFYCWLAGKTAIKKEPCENHGLSRNCK